MNSITKLASIAGKIESEVKFSGSDPTIIRDLVAEISVVEKRLSDYQESRHDQFVDIVKVVVGFISVTACIAAIVFSICWAVQKYTNYEKVAMEHLTSKKSNELVDYQQVMRDAGFKQTLIHDMKATHGSSYSYTVEQWTRLRD